MEKSNKLPDSFYDGQIKRMGQLQKFPLATVVQHEIRRALRRISDTDASFIETLITEVVDSNIVCPTPAELIRRAGDIRQRHHTTVGRADCDQCRGCGFIAKVRKVAISGLAPYEAEFAETCGCRGGK